MNRIDDINSRGHASGWHAQQLQAECIRTGQTMAESFKLKSANMAGFNVPAKCIKVTSAWIHYEFLDGSKDKYINTSGKVR